MAYDDPYEVEVTVLLHGETRVTGRRLEEMVRRNLKPEVLTTTGATSRVRLVGTERALREYVTEVHDPEGYGTYAYRAHAVLDPAPDPDGD